MTEFTVLADIEVCPSTSLSPDPVEMCPIRSFGELALEDVTLLGSLPNKFVANSGKKKQVVKLINFDTFSIRPLWSGQQGIFKNDSVD